MTKLSSIALSLLFSIYLTAQTAVEQSKIRGDLVWDSDTIRITEDIEIGRDFNLYIYPGCYIEFQGHHCINCYGNIFALGNSNDYIKFTIRDTTYFWEDTLSSRGGWGGIRLMNNPKASSRFEYCQLEFAKKNRDNGDDICGGAIKATNYGNLDIQHCYFCSNMVLTDSILVYPAMGAAIYCENTKRVYIAENHFIKNRSFNSGGAIHIDKGCKCAITGNFFKNNKAINYLYSGGFLWLGGRGGAVTTTDAFGESPEISHNYCFNNKSATGILYTSNKDAKIHDNVVCNNWGVGYFDGHQLSKSRIYNNTICNNDSQSGGIEINSQAKIYNNICAGNKAYPGQQNDQIDVEDASTLHELFNNCVTYGDGGNQAVYGDPQLMEPSPGAGLHFDGSLYNWRLCEISPCINHGCSDTSGQYIPETDIEGCHRIFGEIIDIGAYENQQAVGTIENNMADKGIKIYPIPATSVLNIITGELNGLHIYLSTIEGREIVEKKLKHGLNNLDLESIRPGIYLYNIKDEKGKNIQSGQWIKI